MKEEDMSTIGKCIEYGMNVTAGFMILGICLVHMARETRRYAKQEKAKGRIRR